MSPPVFTTAEPVPLASDHVSYVQWIAFGEHCGPVRSDVAPVDTMSALFFSRAIWLTASTTEEVGTSTMTSTLSASNHCRAICEPTSGLF